MLDRRLKGLSTVVRALSQQNDTATDLRAALDAVLDVLGADHASVRLCQDDAELVPLARAGVGADVPASAFRKGQGVLGWSAKTGRIARVSDSNSDARFEFQPDSVPMCSIMTIPLMDDDRVLGVFSASSQRRDAFAAEHEELGIVIGYCVAQRLKTAELERQAMTDALTGAYNRSHHLPCLRNEMNRARREGRQLSVLLMDLDHFKDVNDRFGHAIGDLVLRRFADVVRGCVRSFDVLVRRGGEEFELIMPSTSSEEGWRVAERIRIAMRETPLRFPPGVDLRQTVSIGLATWDNAENADALDERADAAMYVAKRHGRDRTVVAPTASSGSMEASSTL